MSIPIRNRLIAGGLSILLMLGAGVAGARAQEPVPVKREVLALYDGAQEGEADFTRIHRLAELPLNHLGFVLRFHDIRTKLPEPAEMERYRGVLTWFASPVPDSNGYLAWVSQVSRMNVRYVILGDVGVAVNSANIPIVNRLLGMAGVHHTGDYVTPTLGTQVVQKNEKLIEFECRLDPVLSDYPVVNVSKAGTQIGLMLETPPQDGKRKTALVAIGQRGGYAASNYEYCHQQPPLYQGRWMVNPFTFFGAAFGLDDSPVPDTTTASGNRLYFSVLDKEGWTRPSKIEGSRDILAGEVVVQDLIEAFKDLPVTVDPYDAEIAKSGRGGQQAQALLQRMLASTNVDPSQRWLRVMRSRLDTEYPSVSNLSPMLSSGPDRIINAPMSNEIYYNKAGPVGENGFVALKETVANTEAPRRLTPFNLNYHAYAGEYPALLRSVKDRLLEARGAALTPISANRYAAIVDGFSRVRVDRTGSASWRISDRGEMQTVRFDAAEGREVDLQSSTGVIGQKRNGATLYVALDGAIEPATIVIRPSAPPGATSRGFSLVESRWLIRQVVKDECSLSFEAQGYGDGSFSWSGAMPGRYTIIVDRAGKEIRRQEAEADGAGQMKFVLPVSAIDPVMVKVHCANAARSAEQ